MLDTVTSLREEVDTLTDNLARERTVRQAEVGRLETEVATLKAQQAMERLLRRTGKAPSLALAALEKDLKGSLPCSSRQNGRSSRSRPHSLRALLTMRERLTGGGK